jgi:hypothetical protein
MNHLESPKFNRHEWLSEVLASGLGNGPKLVAGALWRFANESGYCWPNQDQISQAIGHKSIGRISQYTKELSTAGVIKINYMQGHGKFRSANYQLVTPTDVGYNLIKNININNVQGLKALEHINNYGKLMPTDVGIRNNHYDDYVVDGRDVRPPPSWATGL